MSNNKFDFSINDIPDLDFSREKKKKVNSVVKGKNFERFIANDLSKRFSDKFIRVPCSGGIVGGKFNFIKNQYLSEEVKKLLSGDIICPNWFPFVLELKNYKDEPKLQNILLFNENFYLDKWIDQCEKESHQSQKPWLLIFKITKYRKNIFCLFNQNIINDKNVLQDIFYLKYKKYIIIDYNIFWNCIFNKIFNK